MTEAEEAARASGWRPTCEAHVMFKASRGVCRHLKGGEKYTDGLDSYMSVPLRHARDWEEACLIDAGIYPDDDEGEDDDI